jgi:hypothetical protein
MTSFALATRVDPGLIRRAPKPVVLFAVVLAGCAVAGFSVASALASDHVRDPGVQAALVVWVILAYILAGVIAWWRRPESRFGPLMVAAGFGTFIAMLGWSNVDLLRTIGQTLDFLPPILFLHVFLAFPSGGWSNRQSGSSLRPRTSRGSASGSSGCCLAASGPTACSS